MKVIYKFPLQIADEQTINLPYGAKLLSFQVQNGIPTLWALVDAEAEPINRTLHIFGTGNEIPNDPGKYVGTIQMNGFVWHLFDGEK